MGRPKALVVVRGRPLLVGALAALRDGGCAPLVVVLGAEAEAAAELVPPDVRVVVARAWADGMGASLRAGLAALEPLACPAALVHLVDLPGVGPAAITRLAAAEGPEVLARAAYHGVPGHPVLLGRSHWPGVRAAATGDAGARGYLAGHPALRLIECGDVADPGDVDTPESLRALTDPPTEPT
jgi:nicotine blue oxidoreductase